MTEPAQGICAFSATSDGPNCKFKNNSGQCAKARSLLSLTSERLSLARPRAVKSQPLKKIEDDNFPPNLTKTTNY